MVYLISTSPIRLGKPVEFARTARELREVLFSMLCRSSVVYVQTPDGVNHVYSTRL